jgi:hypothetical protein
MKKILLLIVSLLSLVGQLYGEDFIYFRVKDGETAYYWNNCSSEDMPFDGKIEGNEPLRGVKFFGMNIINLQYQSKNIDVPARFIESIDTKDVFDDILIREIKTTNDGQYRWVDYTYLEALSKGDRNIIYLHEKTYWDARTSSTLADAPENWPYHFDVVLCLDIYGYGLQLRNYNMWITRIEKIMSGYIVTLLDTDYRYYRENLREESFSSYKFPEDSLGKYFTLQFKLDGDYLDIFQEDGKTLFGRFVYVDPVFEHNIFNLVRNEKIDAVSHWPRRADGSMDYPPPQLAQITPKQPETVAIDIPPGEDEDVAAVTLDQETVVQQPGTALPLVIVLAAAGIAIAVGVVVFLIRRKR